jgi:AcrR family transcriptional regulator
MARPKQISDERLKLVARKIFLERGVNTPVAVVAKELGVTPAALFHRAKSKERLISLALWPPDPPELESLRHGPVGPGAANDDLAEILFGLNSYFALAVPAIFLLHMGGVTPGKNSTKKTSKLPTMLRLRRMLAGWLQQATANSKLDSKDPQTLAEALLGALEARHLHGYLGGKKFSTAQNRNFTRALVAEVLG